jgi:hypothetical protein
MNINTHALQVLFSGIGWGLSVGQARPLLQRIAGILLTWLRVAGVAVAMSCASTPAEVAVVTPAHIALKCAGCGMVESMRPRVSDAADASERYEVTVRMKDGTIRVIPDANPGSWRIGERVTLIEGEGAASE